ASQVADTDATAHFVPGGVLTTFTVVIEPFVVNATNDEVTDTDGKFCLREAIALTNSIPGPDTIVFDPAVFATPQSLKLSNGPLQIADALTINGPDGKLTIDAQRQSRVFTVDVPNAHLQPVSISHLSLTNGNDNYAAGILNADEAVALF